MRYERLAQRLQPTRYVCRLAPDAKSWRPPTLRIPHAAKTCVLQSPHLRYGRRCGRVDVKVIELSQDAIPESMLPRTSVGAPADEPYVTYAAMNRTTSPDPCWHFSRPHPCLLVVRPAGHRKPLGPSQRAGRR